MFITILFISYYENIELTLYFLIIFIHILLWVFCYINVREYRRAIKMDKNGYILVLLLFVMILMFNLIKDWSFTCRPCIVTVLIFSSEPLDDFKQYYIVHSNSYLESAVKC